MKSNKPSLGRLVGAICDLREEGTRMTLLGIGPMSDRVITCALKVSGERGFPLKFIASRNQVDFDGGYVQGLTQAALAEKVRRRLPEGHHGWVYLCGDHYGPGRKEGEKDLRFEQALDATQRSCVAALGAGWDLLHLDPTVDPAYPDEVPAGLVMERTRRLWSSVEEARKTRGLPPVSYEVGSEPTSGRLTEPESCAALVRRNKELEPAFVVGHVGPYIKMDLNIGSIDFPRARSLYERIRDASKECGFPCGLKVHNVDYSTQNVLKRYPYYGIAAANVAPEFGVTETKAHLELADRLGERGSEFVELLQQSVLNSGRYKKWLLEDTPEQVVRKDTALLDWVTQIGGHYEFSRPEIAEAAGDLLRAAGDVEDDPPGFVERAVETAIERYIEPFGLGGSVETLAERLRSG